MFDTIKAIAIWSGIILVGMLAGIFWHAHGGSIWLIPLLAFAAPLAVAVCIFAWTFFRTDWSH